MQKLLKLSLSISLIGVLALFFISSLQLDEISISEINDMKLNSKIKIKGEIISQRNYDNFRILTLEDETGKIDVKLNCQDCKNLTGKNLEVTGRLQEYKDKIQIRAEKISETGKSEKTKLKN